MRQEKVGNQSDQNRDKLSLYNRVGKRVGVGIFAVAVGLGLTGCGDKVEAIPNESTPSSSAPVTPGTTESTAPTTEAPTPTSTPSSIETTTPTIPNTTEVETPDTSVGEVPSFREWNIAPDTADRLETAETDLEKWKIIKEVIKNNNDPGVYHEDTSLETRNVESMFNRTLIELSTMSDIGQDPNAENGDIISKTWAELAIIDEDTRAKFIDLTSNMRMILSTSDQETIDSMMEINREEPFYHLQPEILHSSSDVNHFHDSATARDYTGITFTGIYEVPDYYNEGFVTTMTVVLDFGNYTTQILREYPESTPGGWEVSYDPGDAPIKVSEIPAVKEKTGS